MTIKGFATTTGTKRYRERIETSKTVSGEHFNPPFCDLHLTRLGMGTYLGNPDDKTDRQVAEAAVQSVASGVVNVLDTAINYRFQKAERALGQALGTLAEKGFQRDEVFISSKNGYLTPDADVALDFQGYITQELIAPGVIKPEDLVGGSHCMTPAFLADQLDRSRRNLGIETLDLMYLHNAAESQLPAVGRERFMDRLAQAFTFYEHARTAGKIRHYGLATWNCFRQEPSAPDFLNLQDVVALAQKTGGEAHGFRFVQLPFNLAFHEAASLENQTVDGQPMSFLEAAELLGIGVFTSVPLLQGQLLGQRLPQFEGLKTPAQRCLQFVRSHPGVLAPLVGHKQPAHVAENLAVASVPPLSPEQLQQTLMTV